MQESINDILPGLDLQNTIEFLLAFFLTKVLELKIVWLTQIVPNELHIVTNKMGNCK